MAEQVIAIQGLADLQRAFRFAENAIGKDLKAALLSSAEPVRVDAESLARVSIKVSKIDWSKMRVGVTQSSVYVAPVERGVSSRYNPKRRRRKLKPRLLEQSLDPALAKNRDKVIGEVEDTLDDLARAWSRV